MLVILPQLEVTDRNGNVNGLELISMGQYHRSISQHLTFFISYPTYLVSGHCLYFTFLLILNGIVFVNRFKCFYICI